ncbi:RNA polymerase sigma factor [Micropruina sonneratiae]|uniref:RNA polymerase sigma factor n=2 Tax=Bacteria TaxID=2 RepID=UPI002227C555|nr:sigma-70 family RNA polymerase sigma factor [Micropruina sp. KQZ13P-5]MCW3158351.1 sigma-70 family RNA polymerase sigma factor [Micropruina sp. KQZ13P-5]
MAASDLEGRPESAETSVWVRAARCFERWQGGEAAALDELVRIMTPVLWHTIRAYGLAQAAAEDAVQNTWLALVRNGHQVTESAAIGGWLLTTARRTAWRAKSSDTRAMPTEDAQLAAGLPASAAAETSALEQLGGSVLWEHVRGLDERCQRLIRIVAFDDRPDYSGIAKDLGMPIGSIGPTRRRCLDKLRNSLEKGGQL